MITLTGFSPGPGLDVLSAFVYSGALLPNAPITAGCHVAYLA